MSENNTVYDWVSIGGGAAGFFGAIQFAEAFRSSSKREAKILILEASSKILSKLKISGGGRCNVTHHCFDISKLVSNYPRGQRELVSVFSKFSPKDCVEWFEKRGVPLKTESDGRIFPKSDRSESIIHCLDTQRKNLGIELRTKAPLKGLSREEEIFSLKIGDDDPIQARRILFATGSNPKVWQLLKNFGFQLVDPVPSLFSFNIEDARLQGLSGRSFKKVRVTNRREKKKLQSEGPMLITHWGLSGPAVLKFSSLYARELHDSGYKGQIEINFMPDKNGEELRNWLKSHQEKNKNKKLKNSNPLAFPEAYWENLLQLLNWDPDKNWEHFSKKDFSRLIEEIESARFELQGKTTNKEEFVTAGGVELKEVDFRRMESKDIAGIYFAGEVLNIDGVTGGFNFQAAWSTSFVAAQSAALSLRSPG